MISKKTLKTILRISIWTYIILTCCPQLVELVKTLTVDTIKLGVHHLVAVVWSQLVTEDALLSSDNIEKALEFLKEHNTFSPDKGY